MQDKEIENTTAINTYVKNKDNVTFEICLDSVMDDSCSRFLLSLINDFEEGEWRFEKFNQYIMNTLAETALTKKEREALREEPYSLIKQSIANLNQKEGELGEIFLYGIMKKYYNALPIVPKIFYKQNANDYAKGADSVHLTIENKECHLWLGESKFCTNITDAIDKAIESIKNLLVKKKLNKEKSIITNINDLELYMEDKKDEVSEENINKIKKILRQETPIDELKNILHIPISIIYQCNTTKAYNELSEEYKQKITKFHQKKAKQAITKITNELNNVYKVEKIKFHIILFPVPDKKRIRCDFTKKLEVAK
ncbi:HamA C-terminal domain-containing protein [Campylobacter coli]